jgi:hypothetical protein
MQMALAFAVGILYSSIALKFNTILFGVIAHFLTNITGLGGGISVSATCYYVLMIIALIVNITYGVWLTLKNIKQKI